MSQSRKEFLKQVSLGGISTIAGSGFLSSTRFHPRIKPCILEKGDTIGMISPASSLSEEKEYGEVVKEIEKLGFNVKVGQHAKEHYGYFAGTDENRAADLNVMFEDPEVDAIIPFRGGWGSNRILEFIDFDVIRANPKPLIGYSDITSLLLAIYARTGLITYHGPVGKSTWTDFTVSYFKKAVMQDKPFQMKNTAGLSSEITSSTETLSEGQANGVLLGGNLTVLTSMLGSEYLPGWRNSILFLEDVGEDIYRVDRMLTQLKLNGVLNKINGLVFGKCTGCEVAEGFHFTLEQILQDHIKNLAIPAFVGTNIGHIDKMFTLPIGIQAKINANKGIITLLESSVASDI